MIKAKEVSSLREFLTVERQIERFRQRGMTVNDPEAARHALTYAGYYRISGYSLTLREPDSDRFRPGVTFDDVLAVYRLDNELRELLFGALIYIETAVKSVWAARLAERYGEFAHKNNALFSDRQRQWAIIADAKRQYQFDRRDDIFNRHFSDGDGSDLPIWALVELFSFTDITAFYRITAPELQQVIAADFGHGYSPDALANNLDALITLRNYCAHGKRIYNYIFPERPVILDDWDGRLLRVGTDGQPDEGRLFARLLVMRRILSPGGGFDEHRRSLSELSARYPGVDLSFYGFPDNWNSVL